MQVGGQHESSLLDSMATGARVSNTYPTYPPLGHSPSKDGLIPDGFTRLHEIVNKGLRWRMGMRSISLLAG